MTCLQCGHKDPHTGGGLGVCVSEGCGCDGSPLPLDEFLDALPKQENPTSRAEAVAGLQLAWTHCFFESSQTKRYLPLITFLQKELGGG